MARIAKTPRRLFSLFGIVSVGLSLAAGTLGIGCEGDKLEPFDPKCKETKCTCEQDPFQPLCKGFNDRPETGPVEFEASRPDVLEGGNGDASQDGDTDAPNDGGDGG
jgi:hypothetical protein